MKKPPIDLEEAERLERQRQVKGNGDAKHRKPRFTLRKFAMITVDAAAAYVIKGLIPRTGLVLIWGPKKCGKSFWTFDVMMHAALGWIYRGHRVQQGLVVYCALEGAHGYQARAEAFRQKHLADSDADPLFYLIGDKLNLAADVKALIFDIRAQLGHEVPIVIVIDTVNRSLGGPEDDKTLGTYIAAADALREAFGCVVLLIHHSGYDESHARGHSSLPAAVDVEISIKRDAAGNVIATVEFMRDGPDGESFMSRLEQVEIGRDQDGDPITSCVIEPIEGKVAKSKPAPKLSDRPKLALKLLAKYVADHGQAPPADFGLPNGVTSVTTLIEWRKALFDGDVLDPEAGNPREEFRRVKDALQSRNLIAVQGGFVWLP